ncbi:hypothetical protein G3578_11520 [Brevibacillus sp. SYP-B805]|uniref:hypothetical protein n=1 Tax=Brevibacillus sp. SYP-B805 TaxID=1578199 RepID=UPI0013EBEE0A|nr:hypothetical protein [Brevibacillus sp. SYP-B805]NGQ95783.1 hypothetical protein [Brevibacillus sp. SYP-B805]
MDHEIVHDHLKKAASHIDMAFMKTKEIVERDAAQREIIQVWNEFIEYLFGDPYKKENHAHGRADH